MNSTRWFSNARLTDGSSRCLLSKSDTSNQLHGRSFSNRLPLSTAVPRRDYQRSPELNDVIDIFVKSTILVLLTLEHFMSWQEALANLLRRGFVHEPSATEALVLFAQTRGVHITFEQAVERLPKICRGYARRILRDARKVGANDSEICRSILTTYIQFKNAIEAPSRDHANLRME